MKCSSCPSQAQGQSDAGEPLCLPCIALHFKANSEALQKALAVVQRERSQDLADVADWLEMIEEAIHQGHFKTVGKELVKMKECLRHQCRPRDRHRAPWR